MSNDSTNDFQKRFVKLALRRLPHHTALYSAAKMRKRGVVKVLDSYAKRHIIGSAKLQNFSVDEQERYRKQVQKTALWHGSGRYQHPQGKVIDVLEGILASGSVRPVNDAYALFSGGKVMTSISLTRLRIIARCYADMHGKGYQESNRYGDALTWVSYHYGLFYARLYTVHYGRVRKQYKTWHQLTHDENGHNTWGKKVNREAQDVWDVFGLGSDIPDNYPIIFGIKDRQDTVPLSTVFRDYEVRVKENIHLKDITHIEVPRARVREVKALLAKYSLKIPVEPIELGEVVASQTAFSELLGLHHNS